LLINAKKVDIFIFQKPGLEANRDLLININLCVQQCIQQIKSLFNRFIEQMAVIIFGAA